MEKQKKTQYGVKHLLWIGITLLLGFFILTTVLVGDGSVKEPTSQIQRTQTQQVVKKLPPEKVPYKVIDEEDISYINCKRVGIRVVVPDESLPRDVGHTLRKIIEERRHNWDDITVWAYKESEESQVGLIPYSKGMEEYSTCG